MADENNLWLIFTVACALLLLLGYLYRNFLAESWMFFTFEPFSRLLDRLAKEHAAHGVALTDEEIDQLYQRVRQAKNRSDECKAIRRELGAARALTSRASDLPKS